MSMDDQPTQQLRVTPPSAEPDPPAQNAEQPNDDAGSTDVLSLDELLDGPTPAAPTAQPSTNYAAPPPASAVTSTAPTEPVAVVQPVGEPVQRPVEQRIGAVPLRPARTGPKTSERVRRDAVAAWQGGLTRSRNGFTRSGRWLRSGDNALIIATLLMAVLLLLVVALV